MANVLRQPVELIVLPTAKMSTHNIDNTPQLHVDQLMIMIAKHNHAARHNILAIPNLEIQKSENRHGVILQGI